MPTTDILCFTILINVVQTPKVPLPLGDMGPHLMHGSLDPPDSKSQTSSQSVQPGSPMCQTHTDTPTDTETSNHAISVAVATFYDMQPNTGDNRE